MNNRYNFAHKKVIISGATRGIGQAIALAFLSSQATVIGTYSTDEDAAQRFSQECAELGYQKALVLKQCDVADFDSVKRFFTAIEKQHDTIDILINNAGIRRDALAPLMSSSDWQRVIDVNLTGSFHMSKFAIPLMLKQKFGRIVMISSPVAYLGFQGQANYAASKAGQIGLTKTLAKETARKKITVNCVSPGFIETDLIADLSREQLSAYKKMVPMRRFGRREEVCSAVLFLASDDAAYISGSVLEVTGGL